MYADDTTLYFNLEDFNSVTMNDDINSCLDKINVWLKLNKLTVNLSKTKFMVFHERRDVPDLNLSLNNINFESVSHFTFLGIILDTALSWKYHTNMIAIKISKVTGICEFSHCSTDVKITLFQSYCTALYCPYLWNDYKKSTFSKVRVAFNNAYRKIFGLPKRSSASTMYANNNICNFETTLRKNTFGFMQRLEQSTNSIISTLYQSWIVRFDIWNSWIKSLYVT